MAHSHKHPKSPMRSVLTKAGQKWLAQRRARWSYAGPSRIWPVGWWLGLVLLVGCATPEPAQTEAELEAEIDRIVECESDAVVKIRAQRRRFAGKENVWFPMCE